MNPTMTAEPVSSAPAPVETPEVTRTSASPVAGRLVVNADDWGRDLETTTKTLDCLRCETVSAVSGMVFMEDSERAAALSQEHAVDTGLHINLSSRFSAANCPQPLAEHHHKVARFLLSHALARVLFHPGLVRSFEYVVKAQIEEFQRLYGKPPDRFDGHHHLHLCANVLVGGLLPRGTLIRRNFSFHPGEKSRLNRFYRKAVDQRLSRHHRVVDFVFALAPLEPASRLERIFSLARQSVVEVETHPVNLDEYRYLAQREILRRWANLRIARGFTGGKNSNPTQHPS